MGTIIGGRGYHLKVLLTNALLITLSLIGAELPFLNPDGSTDAGVPAAVRFTENAGQLLNADVIIYGAVGDFEIGFEGSGFLLKATQMRWEHQDGRMRFQLPEPVSAPGTLHRQVVLRASFVGANVVSPEGHDELPFRSNFFFGTDSASWRTGVRNFREVVYADLYDGIDLAFRGTPEGLKYEFVLRPGANPSDITIAYEGSEGLRITEKGDLEILTAAGSLFDAELVALQDAHPVSCRFELRGQFTYGFRCAGWNPLRPLVIDPVVYITFLGGDGGGEGARGIVSDGGRAIVTGVTTSLDFPATPGAYDVLLNGMDGFVAKMTPSGDGLEFATYFGGSVDDYGESIARDATGSLYVTGRTTSANFPITPDAFDSTYNGGGPYGGDAFLLVLDASGGSLLYSSYLGGSNDDLGWAVAVNGAGDAFLTGTTDSADFPATPGAFDNSLASSFIDAFVARFEGGTRRLVYATYLGGAIQEYGSGIAANDAGDAFVTGYTSSADFPVTPSAYQRVPAGGGEEAFAVRIPPSGATLAYSTYLGGGGFEWGEDVEVDTSGRAWITGITSSPDFPTTADAYASTYAGLYDVFVAQLDPSGSALLHGGFLGGSSAEHGFAIALNSADEVYLAGYTQSPDFPTTGDAVQRTYSDMQDAFVAKLGPGGTTLLYATYLGGVGQDFASALYVDGAGDAFVAGWIFYSDDFPTTPGAFDRSLGGNSDAFVARFVLGVPSGNTAPVVHSFTTSTSREGEDVVFTTSATDAEGDPLTYSYDFESDGVFDETGPNENVSHTYGDDFHGTATVRVSDGEFVAEATTPVSVSNVAPIWADLAVVSVINLTLRVAGEKWHDVSLTLYEDGVAMATASLVRTPGSPDEQAVTIPEVTIDMLSGPWSAVVAYTPLDDPENGQVFGADPAWLLLTARDGSEARTHHTFNARHPETWTWVIEDLRSLLVGLLIDFEASAEDPGSDDLTFTWSWGDGIADMARTYFNDGVGPDPSPSPSVNPIAVTELVMHAFAAPGTYRVVLMVTDDDGGVASVEIVVVFPV